MPTYRKNRRKKNDFLQRSFMWLAIICWGLFCFALLAFYYARPEVEYGLLRYWNIDIRTTWAPQPLFFLLYALWGCFVFTLLSLGLIIHRNRRFEDYQLYYFVFLLVIALVSLVSYYLNHV